MDKLIIGFCLFCLMCSCGGTQKNKESQEMEPLVEDSMTTAVDTLVVEEPVEEVPQLPIMADEVFADFLYNFVQDEKMQNSRIVFPLPCYTDDRKEFIEEGEWVYDPLFSQLDAYSVLFDKVEDMELEKDTVSTSVKIEWIYLPTDRIKRYYFERIKGKWTLEAIDDAAVPEKETEYEDFYDFYERFANDSIFQLERVAAPLKFVTIDPEDEFQLLETTLEKGQWFAFQPLLPRDFLTNVNYGQQMDKHSRSKIIELKGFGNGFCNILHFQRRGGIWKLVKFEDLGD